MYHRSHKKFSLSLVLDCFCITLFSTLEQTHNTLVTCDSEWVSSFHYSAFLNSHWRGILTMLFGRYMAGTMWNSCHLGTFCVHHTLLTMKWHKTLIFENKYGPKNRIYTNIDQTMHFFSQKQCIFKSGSILHSSH